MKNTQKRNRPLSVAAQKVIERLEQEAEPIGNITDFHVKWLMGFTTCWFNVDNIEMAFDFTGDIKIAYICPYRKDKVCFGRFEWFKIKTYKMWKNKTERDLPGWIGLPKYVIRFVRVLPKTSKMVVT